MRNFKLAGISLLLALSLSQTGFAQTTSNKPDACPSISAIKNLGVNDASNGMLGWIGTNVNRYDTNDAWLFALPVPDANSKEDAISKGNVNIQQLSDMQGPLDGGQDGTWACMYSASDFSVFGFTFTPVPSDLSLVAHFARFKK